MTHVIVLAARKKADTAPPGRRVTPQVSSPAAPAVTVVANMAPAPMNAPANTDSANHTHKSVNEF